MFAVTAETVIDITPHVDQKIEAVFATNRSLVPKWSIWSKVGIENSGKSQGYAYAETFHVMILKQDGRNHNRHRCFTQSGRGRTLRLIPVHDMRRLGDDTFSVLSLEPHPQPPPELKEGEQYKFTNREIREKRKSYF